MPTAVAAPFGSTLLVGGYGWGPVNKVVAHNGRGEFLEMRDKPLREDPTNLSGVHWYQMAAGAGKLLTLRITDGDEAQAHTSVYDRNTAAGRRNRNAADMTPPAKLLDVYGAYPGRRGGQRQLLVGQSANLATAFNGTAGTFDTGTTMLVNQFKDAELRIPTHPQTYKVTANTTAGVLSIEVGSGDAGPTGAGVFEVSLERQRFDQSEEGVGIRIDGSPQNAGTEVQAQIWDFYTSAAYRTFESLGLDTTKTSHWTQQVTAGVSKGTQNLITVVPQIVADPSADESRPANWVGHVRPESGQTAVGFIVCIASGSHVAGETVTISDGINSVTFEYHTAANLVQAGNTYIEITGTANAMAQALIAAVNASALDIRAQLNGGATVQLAGLYCRTSSNAAIVETVANAGYVVAGMGGSAGLTTTLRVETDYATVTSPGGGNCYLDTGSAGLGGGVAVGSRYGADPVRCRAVCTFTSPTAFNYVYQTWEGANLTAGSSTLTGTLGTLAAHSTGHTHLPAGFTLRAGASAMAAGDEAIVWFNPIPADVVSQGAKLYPHAHDQGSSLNDVRSSMFVSSASGDVIVAKPGTDLGGATHRVAAAQRARVVGQTGAATYNMANNETIIYSINGENDRTITYTGGVNAATPIGALVGGLNQAELTRAAAASEEHQVMFTTYNLGGTDYVVMRSQSSWGANASLEVNAASTLTQIGLGGTQPLNGSDGTIVAMSYPQELWGGRDGIHSLGASTEYTDAFDTTTSPIIDLKDANYGLIKVATPGVSDPTAQNAAINFCDLMGYMYRAEIDPSDANSSGTAVKWVRDNLIGSRNTSIAFDSYAYPRSQVIRGDSTAKPLAGAILGLEARNAAMNGGYHVTTSGVGAGVGVLFANLASASGFGDPPKKDDKTLFATGLQGVNQVGANVYLWGGRNTEDNYLGTVWKHKVECILHLMHQLRVAGAPFIFKPLTPEVRLSLAGAILPLLRDMFDAGWFARQMGESFDDIVSVNVGNDVNPPSTQALGELRCEVSISGIVGTAERVIFTLGSAGVGVQESATGL